MEKSISIFNNYPTELMTQEFVMAFNEWIMDKHNLSKWLILSKILAKQIDANYKEALKLRNSCVEETK